MKKNKIKKLNALFIIFIFSLNPFLNAKELSNFSLEQQSISSCSSCVLAQSEKQIDEKKQEDSTHINPDDSSVDSALSSSDQAYLQRSKKAENFVFKTFPKHIGLTLKESFWGWGSLAIAASAGASAGIYSKDKSISSSFEANHYFGSKGNKIIAQVGAPYTLAAAGLITDLIGKKIKNPKLEETGESMVESIILAEAMTYILKPAFHRTRPNGGSMSFPSGHSAGAFAAASVLQSRYGFKLGLPAYAFASAVAFSRVDSKSHYVSDVFFAAALGSLIGYSSGKIHQAAKKEVFHFVPVINSDSVSLMYLKSF